MLRLLLYTKSKLTFMFCYGYTCKKNLMKQGSWVTLGNEKMYLNVQLS